MILMLVAATAAPFAVPVADTELATVSAYVQPTGSFAAALLPLPFFGSSATQDVVDNWWADDGAALIAEAVRPEPALLAGLTLLGSPPATLTFRFIATASASTAP